MAKVVKKVKTGSTKSEAGPLYSVTVFTNGNADLKQPVILERTPAGLLVSAGRHASSKRDLRFLPIRDIVYSSGQIGAEGNIRVRTSFKDFSLTGYLVDSSPDSLTFKDEDGELHTIATNDPTQRLEIVADIVAAPKAKVKSKKPAPAAAKASKGGDEASAKKKVKVKSKKKA